MRRIVTLAFMMTMVVVMAHAQGALKKVYNESIDPMTQIDEALVKAKADGKFVICQVGGNWCPWCLKFADFVEKDTAVNKVVNDNFEYIHVNYNPRKAAGAEAVKKAESLMKRLNNPSVSASLSSWFWMRRELFFISRIPASWKKVKAMMRRRFSAS